jgi:hypothetical protein
MSRLSDSLTRAARRKLPETREHRLAVGGLLVLLLAGAALRVLFMVAWQPAFMGWPDAKSYIDVSQGELFGNVLRPAGYPLFLRGLYEVAESIALVVIVNHLLGLATAVLLYLAVVRAGGPRWLGLVPAGIVALGGDQMFLEHSPLTEAPFTFLVALAVYAAARTIDKPSWTWPAVAGIAIACASTVRVVGLAVIPVLLLWFLVASRGTLRRRAATMAVAAAGALAILGTYLIAEYRAVGDVGMSRNGGFHLYGRVAPFADCTKFTPPAGTEPLCETTPRSERPIVDAYVFNYWFSPGVRWFNSPFYATPEASDAVAAWAWQAIQAQPLDYIEEVGAGMLRYVAPENDWLHGYGGGPGYDALVGRNILFNPTFQRHALSSLGQYYGWHQPGFRRRPELLSVLRAEERVTRVQGPWFVLLAVLSALGPLLARTRRAGSAALLFTLVAWTLLTVPVATLEFSSRTAVPGFGFLGAAGAVGGMVVVRRWRARRRRGAEAPEAVSAERRRQFEPRPAG